MGTAAHRTPAVYNHRLENQESYVSYYVRQIVFNFTDKHNKIPYSLVFSTIMRHVSVARRDHRQAICIYTGYTQKTGAVSKVNKKFISHLTRAQRTQSAAATVQVSHVLITILQCVHPGSHDTHPHGNQIHPRLGVARPL
jgi:hypothetical protein